MAETELEVPATMHIESPPVEEAEAPQSEAEGEKRPDPRAEIMARIFEKRQAQVAKELELSEGEQEGTEPAASAEPIPAADANPPPAPEPTPATEPSAAAPVQPQKIPLVVDGQRLEVTPDELVQLAQKGLSAQQRWQEAARMRQEAQAMLAQPPTPQAQPQQQTPPAADDLVPDTLARDVARRLNYGTEEEQIKAIRDLVAGVQAKSGERTPQGPAPQELVNAAVTNALAAVDFRSTLAALGQEFPKVFEDTDLTEMAGRRVYKAKQEQAIRVQQGLPVQLKPDYELMRDACKFVQDRYILPQGTPQAKPNGQTPNPSQAAPSVTVDPARVERKRAAPKPPAAANRVAQAPAEKPPPTPSDVVAWMRQKRHQPDMR
ncbi:MAG TPA: hypothetical protein VJQ82_08745 [Terriglobales bacterium]|nr:hypothetical protein [Terriglobales bacterium]